MKTAVGLLLLAEEAKLEGIKEGKSMP